MARDFRYQRVELMKAESLGMGSYGTVCKAICDDLPCAAKILNPAFFQFTTAETTSITRKFEDECHLLCAIKHPHIVQYLGMYCDPESKLPVLLMELMDESLTQFLEQSYKPLPYHTEVNLCHDMALALSYLHSNGIVHKDLSSNNVLLIAGSRAKVTDFGMAKLYNVNQNTAHLTPLTLRPGTVVYMSPEALNDQPVYTDKLDSFSFGVLCVQIMTRQFPNPGEQVTIVENPFYSADTIKMPVSEVERRQSHIKLINQAHPLLLVALKCLKDQEGDRPSTRELCHFISELKRSPQYTASMQRSQEGSVHSLSEQELGEIKKMQQKHAQQTRQIQDLQQQLLSKDDQLKTLGNQLRVKEQEVQQQFQQIIRLRNLLTADQLQSLQQFTPKDEEKAFKDDRLHQKEVSIRLKCRDCGKAPCKIWGEVTAVDGNIAYYGCSPLGKEVYSYDSSSKKWSELPKCPNYGFSLALVSGLLTAIGGKMPNKEVTNSLSSLSNNHWIEHFPPMPTKRWLTIVVCSVRYLLVAGGSEGYVKLSTVEVMDTDTLQWSTASSLPHPLSETTATLCGDQVYILGGINQSSKQSKSVFTCSLASLLQSCQPQLPRAEKNTLLLAGESKVWQQLPETPYYLSKCTSLQGQLLAVGGCEIVGTFVRKATMIHMYNATTNRWEIISHMITPRYRCQVAVFPHNELMIVGGRTPDGLNNSVEIATLM